MVRQRVRRLANPARRRRRTSRVSPGRVRLGRNRKGQFVKRRNSRRKARAAAPRRRTRRAANPRRVRRATRNRARTAPRKVRRRRLSNPVLVTLGTVNPSRRRNTKVARRRRRHPVARRRRRRNARVVVVSRRANTRRRRRVSRRNPRRVMRRQRRNPELFGHRVGSLNSVTMVFGGLIGVTAAKLLPTFLPASFISSPIMRVVTTGASAFVAGMIAGKVAPGMASAVLFGGLMQTVSVGLNVFVPSIGSSIGLSGRRGMGDLVPGQFTVPQNPIYPGIPPAMPTTARTNMSGLARAFAPAWG